eukprot:scaffold32263_cov23-Tisochrysis_lutea.AAC.2
MSCFARGILTATCKRRDGTLLLLSNHLRLPEVSDAAAGGQILMEGNTFAAIKDSLGELGT